MFSWLRTRLTLARKVAELEFALELKAEELAAVKEQRDTFRDALQALRWESIAYGAAHKTDVERLRAGNP